MQIFADSPDAYVAQLPEERREPINQLRAILLQNLPDGFEETMSYGMIGYVVPHSRYPAGYHCDPKLPLPFISIAAQKNFYAFYHMGIYIDPELMDWFAEAYPKHSSAKLDMGKSCIRFKKPEHIPYALLGELAGKITPEQWVGLYEARLKR
jgi:hypothetical protein